MNWYFEERMLGSPFTAMNLVEDTWSWYLLVGSWIDGLLLTSSKVEK